MLASPGMSQTLLTSEVMPDFDELAKIGVGSSDRDTSRETWRWHPASVSDVFDRPDDDIVDKSSLRLRSRPTKAEPGPQTPGVVFPRCDACGMTFWG